MDWSCTIIVIAILSSVSCYSGAGLGSAENEDNWTNSHNQAVETVIHEITATNSNDTNAASYERTTESAVVVRPCETEGNCTVTETPKPTRILSADISDDPTDDIGRSEKYRAKTNTNYGSYDVSKSYALDNAHKFFYHALETIIDQVKSIVRHPPTHDAAREFESKVNTRLVKIEDSLGNILTSLQSLKTSQATDATVRDKSDLVATETWSYIDSKFTELKSNILTTNEKIKSELEEKLNKVLQNYNKIGK